MFHGHGMPGGAFVTVQLGTYQSAHVFGWLDSATWVMTPRALQGTDRFTTEKVPIPLVPDEPPWRS